MKINNYIKGLAASKYSNDVNNMLLFTGSDSALDRLKKRLTVTNKSIGYRINMLKKDIKEWSKKGGEYAFGRVEYARAELEKISKDLTVEYFMEHSKGVVTPAGFWYLAENIIDDSHLNTSIEPYLLDWLRDYQKEAVCELLKYKRATCVLATGLGKSATATSLALSGVKKDLRSMIIVPTQDLVDQFVESVKKSHDSVTGAHSAKIPKIGCDIMVCTAGTAQKHIDKFDIVVIDECHRSSADTWAELLGSCEHAEYVYNFTATPFRSDGLDIGINAFGGPVVYERDLIWGIENGWLESFDAYCADIYAKGTAGNNVIVSSRKQNTTAYKQIVSNKAFLEKVLSILKKANSSDRKIMMLFKTLKPAKELAKMSKGTLNISVADAKWKKPLRDFQSGKSNILVATSKLVGEGIDIPEADMLILCTQNSSEVISFQALGRILRKKEGKKKPILIDIIAGGYMPFQNAGENRRRIWKRASDSVKDINI